MTTKSIDSQNLTCALCGLVLSTVAEKRDHLRLHCVTCSSLLDSREALIEHMKTAHDVTVDDRKSLASPFWNLPASKHADPLDQGSWGNGFGKYEDDQDLSEFLEGHQE